MNRGPAWTEFGVWGRGNVTEWASSQLIAMGHCCHSSATMAEKREGGREEHNIIIKQSLSLAQFLKYNCDTVILFFLRLLRR